jgi:hypothetical protein
VDQRGIVPTLRTVGCARPTASGMRLALAHKRAAPIEHLENARGIASARHTVLFAD